MHFQIQRLYYSTISLIWASCLWVSPQITPDKPDSSFFTLENQGLVDGKIIVQNNDKELSFEPSEFVIKPGQSETVKCKKRVIASVVSFHEKGDFQVID